MDDLTKEEYQGEVLMSNPAISGTNYAVVNAFFRQKDRTKVGSILKHLIRM